MAQIINLFNGGKKTRKTGVVNVNSSNVYPTTIVATASPGTPLSLDLLDSYEFFTGQQTSAATDRIILPEGARVGTEIIIQATNSFGVIKSGSDTINGVGTICTLTAGGTGVLRKVSATAWKLTNIAANGALTNPTT